MDQSPHPIVVAAAGGELPEWAVAGEKRRAHMARVSDLLGSWADALGLDSVEGTRWRAVGYLHDALRDEDHDVLRERLPPVERGLPGPLLHGPAASERLRIDGVEDGELLRAVAWHTVGDPGFRALGRALYAADFLEPGRTYLPEWRAGLRQRMPHEMAEVVWDVARARIGRGLERNGPLLARTVGFWNRLAEEAR